MTALVNTAGTVLERYLYDPYGNLTVMDGAWGGRSGSLYDSTILFAGYWRDSETGLYHVRNRMYHVRLGLWLQRDPEGYVDGMSLYEYVGGGPVGYGDPFGLQAEVGGGLDDAYVRYGKAAADWMDEHNVGTRIGGVAKFAGGFVEGFIGCGVTFGSVGVLGALGGFEMWAHGADVADAGLRQAWSGKSTETQTHGAIKNIAQKAGADASVATQIADYGDVVLSAANMAFGASQLTAGNLSRANQTLNLSGTPQATAAPPGSPGRPYASGEAHSAGNAIKLDKSLGSQQQVGEIGTRIAGEGTGVPLRDAGRLAEQHGGSSADWAKMRSSSHLAPDGTRFETHWVENMRTGERFEFKTKIGGGAQ